MSLGNAVLNRNKTKGVTNTNRMKVLLVIVLMYTAPLVLYSAGNVRGTAQGFSWAWITDTQYYTNHPAWTWIYDNMTTWIAQNGSVSRVIHTGDVVQDGTVEGEYQIANQSMSILTKTGIPFGTLAGNHDGSTLYQKYFGPLKHYELVSAGSVDFVIVYLSYSVETSEVAWANSIFSQYYNRFGILAVHSYLNVDGSYTGEGSTLYNQVVVPNKNIQMVLCGHMHGYALNTKTIGSRVVYEMLADQQELGSGGNGWLVLLQFDVLNSQVHLRAFSSMLNTYNSFDHVLNVNMGGPTPTTTTSVTSTSIATTPEFNASSVLLLAFVLLSVTMIASRKRGGHWPRST